MSLLLFKQLTNTILQHCPCLTIIFCLCSTKPRTKSAVKAKTRIDNVAVADDELFLTELKKKDFSIGHTVSNIEQRLMETDDQSTFRSDHDDVLPTPAGKKMQLQSTYPLHHHNYTTVAHNKQ